jgi:general secretion pathway protein D
VYLLCRNFEGMEASDWSQALRFLKKAVHTYPGTPVWWGARVRMTVVEVTRFAVFRVSSSQLVLSLFLAGCATQGVAPNSTAASGSLPGPDANVRTASPQAQVNQPPAPTGDLENRSVAARDPISQIERRVVPSSARISIGKSGPGIDRPVIAPRRLDVAIGAQPLPEFINTVFGDLLKLNFVIGDGLTARSDQVALRSASGIQSQALFDVAMNALEDYGVGAYYKDGALYFSEFEDLKRGMPRFIRARARGAVPQGMRPVVQYVDIVTANLNQITTLLEQAFPDKQVTVKTNTGDNSITIAGLPDDVDQALSIVDSIDVPQFAGTPVVTFRPRNWKSTDLANQLAQQLTMEGYTVSTTSGATRAINILAIPYTNQVSIFTNYNELREHALESAMRLDADAASETLARKAFVYKAKYYDAEDLARVLDSVLSSMSGVPNVAAASTASRAAPATGTSVGRDAGGKESSSLPGSGRVIVDQQGNRLVFYGSQEEYDTVLDLLAGIDQPASEVLIEVTIAEVQLNKDNKSGLEFLFQQLGSKGYAIGAGTAGGLGLAAGGLTGTFETGDWVIDFGALASNNLLNILSEPRIVTKSGAVASISIGSEVPIITSQIGSEFQTDGSTNILQNVTYRKTGIILDVEPIVFSDYRIDLKISQEVSAAQQNPNQAIASPVISNRSLNTELSLSDGQSAILGGLIEDRYTRGENGIPFLKDIPFLGHAFKTDTLTADRTVLLVMITPYILNDPRDRAEKLEQMRSAVNEEFDAHIRHPPQTLSGLREPLQIPEPRQGGATTYYSPDDPVAPAGGSQPFVQPDAEFPELSEASPPVSGPAAGSEGAGPDRASAPAEKNTPGGE